MQSRARAPSKAKVHVDIVCMDVIACGYSSKYITLANGHRPPAVKRCFQCTSIQICILPVICSGVASEGYSAKRCYTCVCLRFTRGTSFFHTSSDTDSIALTLELRGKAHGFKGIDCVHQDSKEFPYFTLPLQSAHSFRWRPVDDCCQSAVHLT